MEVASPLAFAPAAGSKRSLGACSPPLLGGDVAASPLPASAEEVVDRDDDIDDVLMNVGGGANSNNNNGSMIVQQRSPKRQRRHYADTSIESLSERFSSPFFTNAGTVAKPANGLLAGSNVASGGIQSFVKRSRSKSPPVAATSKSAAVQEDLSRVVDEQAAMIESLKSEKKKVDSKLSTLSVDHERVTKENQILRRAVTIQQDRQAQAEVAARAAQQRQAEMDAKVKKLEQLVLSLRYHLAQQDASLHGGNDFMHMPPRPPDVY